MLRTFLCAVAVLGMSLGLATADEVKGRITKIDDKKVTVVTGKKGETKTAEYDIAKDCKFNKMDKKAKVELSDGIKNDAFKAVGGKKGVPASISVVDGKVTEVVVAVRKKKDAN